MTEDPTAAIERELFLRQFTPVPPPKEVARVISRAMREADLAAGTVLFEIGEPARDLYFIVEGEVQLVGETSTVFRRGAIVGIIDANSQRPYTRKAIALTSVHLLILPYSEWLDVLEDFPGFFAVTRDTMGELLHREISALAPGGGFPLPRSLDAAESAPVSFSVLGRLLALREVQIFSTASVQALIELAERSHTLSVLAGEVVAPVGSLFGRLLVVLHGEVTARRDGPPMVSASFGKHQLVLDASAFGASVNEYRLTATQDSVLMSLAVEDLDDVAEDHFDLVRSFLRATALERETFLARMVADFRQR